MNDNVEQEIPAKVPTAPRITPADIEANIASECFFTAGDASCMETALCRAGRGLFHYKRHSLDDKPPKALDLLTFCVLVLKNGFTVTGESACASPENFDAEVGRKIARQNAVQKIWPFMEIEMPKIKIEVPNVAHVVVTGPTQCGKSLVLARIERVLREELGAQTVSRDLDQERNLGNPDTPADWELKMAAKTTWVLSEA